MGILSSIIAGIFSDVSEPVQEQSQWNKSFERVQNLESDFSDYLEGIGCDCLYFIDTLQGVENVNIYAETRKINDYKRKIECFLHIGGKGKYIEVLDDIESYIEMQMYWVLIGKTIDQDEFFKENSGLNKEYWIELQNKCLEEYDKIINSENNQSQI